MRLYLRTQGSLFVLTIFPQSKGNNYVCVIIIRYGGNEIYCCGRACITLVFFGLKGRYAIDLKYLKNLVCLGEKAWHGVIVARVVPRWVSLSHIISKPIFCFPSETANKVDRSIERMKWTMNDYSLGVNFDKLISSETKKQRKKRNAINQSFYLSLRDQLDLFID